MSKKFKYYIEIDSNGKSVLRSLTGEASKTEKGLMNIGNSGKSSFGSMKKFAGKASLAIGAIGVAVAGVFTGLQKINAYARKKMQIEQMFSKTGIEASNLKLEIEEVARIIGEDYQNTLIATNAVSKAFKIEAIEATELIKEGFFAGANASGEMLESLKEYPHIMKQAGISATEMLDILALSSREGVFSDKGIDAIKEGFLSLREMTPATKKAIEGLGLSAKKFQEEIAGGQKDYLDLMKTISKKMNDSTVSAEAIGAIYADVFRGAGEDSATFITSLNEIDGNLERIGDSSNNLENIAKIFSVFSRLSDALVVSLDSIAGSIMNLFTPEDSQNIINYNDQLKQTRKEFEKLNQEQIKNKILSITEKINKQKKALLSQEKAIEELRESERLRFEKWKKQQAERAQTNIYADEQAGIRATIKCDTERSLAYRQHMDNNGAKFLEKQNEEIAITKSKIAKLTRLLQSYQETQEKIGQEKKQKEEQERQKRLQREKQERQKSLEQEKQERQKSLQRAKKYEQEIIQEKAKTSNIIKLQLIDILEAEKLAVAKTEEEKNKIRELFAIKREKYLFSASDLENSLFEKTGSASEDLIEEFSYQIEDLSQRFQFSFGEMVESALDWEQASRQAMGAMNNEIDLLFQGKEERSRYDLENSLEIIAIEKENQLAEIKRKQITAKKNSLAYKKLEQQKYEIQRRYAKQKQDLEEKLEIRRMSAMEKGLEVLKAGIKEGIKAVAAQAAAKAFESVFSIVPFPMNLITAPIVGATTYASVSAFGNMFASGGYTGDGEKLEPAGIVHRGEIVFEKNLVDRQKNELLKVRKLLQQGYTLQDIILPNVSLPKLEKEPPIASLSSGGIAGGNEVEKILSQLENINNNLNSAISNPPIINISGSFDMEEFVIDYESTKKNMERRGDL